MMKNGGSRRTIRKNPSPNTSDRLSCLCMTRESILMEIANLGAQISENLRRISVKNDEISEVNAAIKRFPN